jgi:hypothetical protein
VSVLTFDTFQQRTEGEAERLKAGPEEKLKLRKLTRLRVASARQEVERGNFTGEKLKSEMLTGCNPRARDRDL